MGDPTVPSEIVAGPARKYSWSIVMCGLPDSLRISGGFRLRYRAARAQAGDAAGASAPSEQPGCGDECHGCEHGSGGRAAHARKVAVVQTPT